MRNVVLLQTAFLGDLLLSVPLMKRIHKLWPGVSIHLICRQGLGPLFKELDLAQYIYEIKKGEAVSYRQTLHEINKLDLDLLLAPHISIRSTLFAAQMKARQKISFRKKRNRLIFSEYVEYHSEWPEALRQLSLLLPLDTELQDLYRNWKNEPSSSVKKNQLSAVPEWASMSMRSIVQNKKTIPAALSSVQLQEILKSPPVLIFPGSVWPTKKWTEEGFLEVALNLQAKGQKIIWMGGSGEESLANDLSGRSKGSLSLAGKTNLMETSWLISQSSLVIGNDSGSSHLAALCDVPVVSIFGPTVLDFGYRPWLSQAYVVERKGLSCRPCGPHGAKKCPIRTHICMKSISANEVLEVIHQLNL